jgi:flagellin-like hook-associated protein FlgL
VSDIVLSRGVRNNLLNLQRTSETIQNTQNKLATGKRVNSALDNPTNFFTSANLQARANDLGNLLDSMSNALKTIEAADRGLTAITKLVESAQSTARQALNGSGGVGAPTLSGSNSGLLGTTTLTSLGFTAGKTITISFDRDGTGPLAPETVNQAVGALTSVDDLINTIGTMNTAVKGNLTAAIENGRLVVRAGNAGATGNAILSVTSNEVTAAPLTNLGFGTNNASVTGSGANLNALQAQFNELRLQIDQLARDTSFNGVNLISSASTTLQVRFNEQGNSSLTVQGTDATAAGLGIGTSGDWTTTSSINDRLAELQSALVGLRSRAAGFGSNLSTVQTRQDFTKMMINTLKTGADNLVLADQNEEGANLLALQTRQQLSQTALSLANQSDQGVLRLFG